MDIIFTLAGMFVVGYCGRFLFQCELAYVRTRRSLSEVQASLVSVDPLAVDAANDGKLIHLCGHAVPEQASLSDPQFGITAIQALRMERHVEMYQWKQVTHRSRRAGKTSTSTTYEKGWFGERIRSQDFKVPGGHENPTLQVKSLALADTIRVGGFQLAPELVGQLDSWKQLRIDTEVPPSGYQRAGAYFVTGDLANPQIGDLRVSFSVVSSPVLVSVVAQQASPDSLQTWQALAGDNIGRVVPGERTVTEMLAEMNQTNQAELRNGRMGFFFILWFGVVFMLGFHSSLFRHVPGAGVLLGKLGVFLGMGLLTLGLAIALWVAMIIAGQLVARLS